MRSRQRPAKKPSSRLSRSKPKSDWLRIGQIVATFGLKGEVKVLPLTDFPSRFEVGSRIRLKGDWSEIRACRWNDGKPVLKIAGVEDVDAARALQWEYIEVPSSSPPKLDEGEYLVEDLIGMEVVTEEGVAIGKVENVLALPAQDVLVIGSTMVPVVSEFVKSIEPDSNTIRVALIPGMLED